MTDNNSTTVHVHIDEWLTSDSHFGKSKASTAPASSSKKQNG